MKKAILLLLFTILALSGFKKHTEINQPPDIQLIPWPEEISFFNNSFELTDKTVIKADKSLQFITGQLRNYLEPATGYLIPVKARTFGRNVIELKLDKNLSSLGDEGYKLNITSKKVQIIAYNQEGIFWGIQTLRQLFPVEILREAKMEGVQWELPCLNIVDKPRFKWRGLMIDYSRTFWNSGLTKKYIDVLAYYKFNKLHMHLTDNQGWRVEIDKYPDLTLKASKFHPQYNEPKENEGFYTKEDIRELIAYAKERNIELIPEIEMPAHAGAVFAAYPEYSCRGDTLIIHPQRLRPKIRTEIFCPGKEETFEFLENILAEVGDLFPTEYVHIGGDEAPKAIWEECPDCQRVIREQELPNETELQCWFTRRIENYLIGRNKKLIGWDEIAQGGLSKTAVVMYWDPKREEAVLSALKQGNKVIMSPLSHLYFDYTYERISTERVYSFEPFSGKFHDANPNQIMGVQANFWSHIDRTEPAMDRQIFPRLLALAEVGWTEKSNRNWDSFQKRLNPHFNALNLMNVYYADEN